MLEFAVRAVGMYFLALLMIRLLGKRALGELGPFDFVVMTGVGHTVIAVSLDKSIPIYEGIAILVTLAFLEYIMGFAALKNQKLSHLISGKPVVLIDNGKIIKENLAKEKFNLDDLFQELRKQGVRETNEVEKGILEPCGGFSIILKEEDEAVSCRDLGLKKPKPNESKLTFAEIKRSEFYNNQDDIENEEEDDEIISLPLSIQNIEDKLNMIYKKIEEIESRIK